MLKQKRRTIICFFITFFIISFSNTIHAETTFVDDCLDENPDCLKELDTTDEIDEENNEENTLMRSIETDSLTLSIIKTVFSLLLIVALIYIVIKFLSKRQKLPGQVNSLENLGGIPVGQNKSIQIVRVGSKIYMIGVGDNVEMLKEITDEEVIDDLIHTHEESGLDTNNFLKSIFKRKKDEPSNHVPNEKFLNLFSKELDKLQDTRQQMKVEYREKEDNRHE